MIAPEDEEVMVRIYKLIPKALLATPALEPLQVALRSEKERDYYYSLMKSIGKAGLVGTELRGGHSLSSVPIALLLL